MAEVNLYQWKDLSKEEQINTNQTDEVYEAPPLYQENQEEKEQEKETEKKSPLDIRLSRFMPPKLLSFSNAQDYLRRGFYMFRTKRGRMQRASYSPSRWYMKPVLDSMRTLDTLLAGDFDLEQAGTVEHAFRETMRLIEKYLEKRKNPHTDEGKARYQMVLDFQKKISFESIRFTERIIQIRMNPVLAPADGKWVSVLADIRCQTYTDGKDDVRVTKGGAGTSDVFILEKDGQKKYFKSCERLPEANIFKDLGSEIQKLRQAEDNGSSQRRSAVLNVILQVLQAEFHNYPDAAGNKLSDYDSAEDKIKYIRSLLKKYHSSAAIRTLKKMEEEQKAHQSNDWDELCAFFQKAGKDYTMHSIATNEALIREGSDMSRRNVAASRMARLLGIPGLIVHTEMTDLVINGEKMRGILMDEAPGTNISEMNEDLTKQGKHVQYSTEAFKQVMSLQVFDVICGQIDRNAANYLFTTKASKKPNVVLADKLVGIDNDMSFGELKYQALLAEGYGINRLRNIESNGQMTLPALDPVLTERILSLRPAVVEYEMMDLLTRRERAALVDRLRGVQKVLRAQKDREQEAANRGIRVSTKFPQNDKAWKKIMKKYAKIAHDEEEERNVYVAVYKEYKEKKRELSKGQLKEIVKECQKSVTVEKISYIRPYAITDNRISI